MRHNVIVFGALLFAALLIGRNVFSDSASAIPIADPFENVEEDEQEDFQTTSERSAINTAKLPYVPNFRLSARNATKPKLFLHVGPVRTGVAKLKGQLLSMKASLLTDKVVVSDQLDTSALQSACQAELNSARQNFLLQKSGWITKPKTLQDVLENEISCWKTFLNSLEPYNQEGMSVILSDELLSQQLLEVHEIGTAVMDWISLRETIMKDWDVVIVASYRRYFDWMPAGKM